MFAGAKINETEGRAVLHTALRRLDAGPVLVDGADVMPGVRATLTRMEAFATGLRAGAIHSPGGRGFTDVVNIGIGGSDLGPRMACRALSPYSDGPRVHFVSNVDGADIHDTLAGLNPASTVFLVASKTFATVETLTNAATARRWLAERLGGAAVKAHFAAISAAPGRAAEFGIAASRVFPFWDWVGGRYSLWSAIGLPLMIAIGSERFTEFLAGGRAIDIHFREAPLAENLPVLMGLVGVWHRNVCGYASQAVLPYDQRLERLPAYLGQLEMESNGKRVGTDGRAVRTETEPVIWGGPGTDGQHAFHQLLHQGTDVVPSEFLVAAVGHEAGLADHHDLLVANCLAQSAALMGGRRLDEVQALMRAAGRTADEIDRLAPHRVLPGNRPSTTIVYPMLTPSVLGQLIALYEHKVFVEGTIWGINSFDQWGVEFGKELANRLQPVVAGEQSTDDLDGSTAGLVAAIRAMRG
jgi:glucose-6-phosphate isomerase